METIKQPPFDVNDPQIQRVCRVVARLLLGNGGKEESRCTLLAVMLAATGEQQENADEEGKRVEQGASVPAKR